MHQDRRVKALAKFLRSPRLVVWLMGLVIGYTALGTLVPQGPSADTAVTSWALEHPGIAGVAAALGFHHAYTTPFFLGVLALLAASTSVCAWDRTGASVRLLRERPASPEFLQRLRERPPIVVAAPSAAQATSAAVRAARSQRLRITTDGPLLEARSTAAGRLGSPLFHWSLAILFLVIPLGQLTRAQGAMDLVEGTSKLDSASSYSQLERGQLHGALSGRIIAVPRIARSFVAGGVQQGVTPFVEIRSSRGDVLAGGFLYPNHLVGSGSLVLHYTDNGLAVVVRATQGGRSFSQEVLLPLDDKSPTGVIPQDLTLSDNAGDPVAEIRIDLPLATSAPASPTIVVSVAQPGEPLDSGDASTTSVTQGGSVVLKDGVTFTAERFARYVRLSVVDDWSVEVMYWLLGIAIAGLSLALLSPIRKAWFLVVEDEKGASIHATALHGRGDPIFASRIESALRDALAIRNREC